jgi:hypothetical protein
MHGALAYSHTLAAYYCRHCRHCRHLKIGDTIGLAATARGGIGDTIALGVAVRAGSVAISLFPSETQCSL